MQSNPGASGAAMFPPPARANRSIFYDAGGNARSLTDIYQRFAAKLDKGAAKVGATSLASDALDGSGATAFASAYGTSAFETARPISPRSPRSLGWAARSHHRIGRYQRQRRGWAKAALMRVNAQSAAIPPIRDAGDLRQRGHLLRPTPDNARLAYLMLASLGSVARAAFVKTLFLGNVATPRSRARSCCSSC